MQRELLEGYLQLFRGREDVHSEGYVDQKRAGKISYRQVLEALTPEVLEQHLLGNKIIGQYQLLPDSRVCWFALDFDKPKEREPGDASPLEEALAQKAAFEAAGLQVYLETSRSGKGYHIWGFFREAVPATLVRNALVPLVLEAKNFDRLYPVQTTVTDTKPYGNLIALPYFGCSTDPTWSSSLSPGVPGGASVFLDAGLEAIPLETFLASVRYNAPAVLVELADSAPAVASRRDRGTGVATYKVTDHGERNPEGRPAVPLRGVLKLISDYGCRFMAHSFKNRRTLPEPMWYAAIQQLTCFEQGREAAHMISRGYDKYTPEETDAKYDQALRHPPVGCQYIHENFPEHACDGCPMTAPYHKAKLPMMTLAGSSEEMLEKSDYKESLKRMRRRRSGEELPGISWGVAGLDRYTRLRPGELSVVGALPSIGKTAFMVDAAVSLAERGVPVFLFSAETGQSGLEDRLLSRVSGVDSKAIRGELPNPLTDEEAAAVEEAAHILSGWPIYVNYTAASPERILELVEEIVLRDGLDWGSDLVIMFDYLQFVSPTQANEHLDERLIVAKASSEFKYLAKITRHAVGVFSQLRRDTEGEDKPDLTWFSSSGRIGQDADVAMIMTGERVPGAISLRYMDIVKQREGDAGVRTESKFHQRISKFEERVSSTPEAQEGPDLFPGEGNPFE